MSKFMMSDSIATDGFERTAQEFQLFSRAGVKILSTAPKTASVGKKYSYPIKVWKQKRIKILIINYFRGPKEWFYTQMGQFHGLLNPLQVDTIKYSIVASHGVATDSQIRQTLC